MRADPRLSRDVAWASSPRDRICKSKEKTRADAGSALLSALLSEASSAAKTPVEITTASDMLKIRD